MNEAKAVLIGFGFAMIPYIAVAWGYSYFTEGGQPTFWRALGVLFVVRLFFEVIESIGRFLAWRFFVRREMVARMLGVFQKHEFPAKQYFDDDFSNLLCSPSRGSTAGTQLHAAGSRHSKPAFIHSDLSNCA